MSQSRSRPLPNDQDASGRMLGCEEQEAVLAALASGTLTSTKGSFVKQFEEAFAQQLGVAHAFACTSGTAAVHVALAALNFNPGGEVVTTSITDMGALTPMLALGLIPVFADVDPHTLNVTADRIRSAVSPRTCAILVTHLFGDPCEMEPILDLAEELNLPVIEDSCQAFGARYQDRLVGTFGRVGCFSLQQGKHITTGEGGIVVTDDAQLARRLFLHINKAWGYGDANPDHYFLALNYRMNELTGAVALAQLGKLKRSVEQRMERAQQLHQALADVPGLGLPMPLPGHHHSYWRYCLDVDEQEIPGGTNALADWLRDRGIACAPRYIQKPAFCCEVFQKQRTFGESRYPFTLAHADAVDYAEEKFVGTYEALNRVLVLPWNECLSAEDVEYIADAIQAGVKHLREES